MVRLSVSDIVDVMKMGEAKINELRDENKRLRAMLEILIDSIESASYADTTKAANEARALLKTKAEE